MEKNILPLFRIIHISCRRLHLRFCGWENLIHINIFISLYTWFINNICNFFPRKLLILCSFGNITLVCICPDIECKILFSFVSFWYFTIDILKRAHITICLVLLIFIIYNKIDFINKYENKSNKYVSKFTIHGWNLLSFFVSLQYP